jgi:hypothetical protein
MNGLTANQQKRHRAPYIVRTGLSIIFLVVIYYKDLAFLFLPSIIHLTFSIIWIFFVEYKHDLVKNKKWIKPLRDVIDFIFMTLLMYITGSANSFAIMLFLGWTVGSSMNEKRAYGLFAALLGPVCVSLLVALEYVNILPQVNVFSSKPAQFILSQSLMSIIALTASTLLIHEFVHTIYRKLVQERRLLKARNEKIERDLAIAKKNQQRIIPQSSPFENIAAKYRPMEMLGGDFYDFLIFEDSSKIGILISDVAGHGTAAAFITSMIKMIVLQSDGHKDDPSDFLSHLNEMLIQEVQDSFVTALYCVYDGRNKRLT